MQKHIKTFFFFAYKHRYNCIEIITSNSINVSQNVINIGS